MRPKASRASIDAFLAEPAIAVVGVSRSGKGFGYAAACELRRKGYRIYPVHPEADVIEGERCYRSLVALPEPVQALLVVVPPERALGIVHEAAAAGITRVWLQQGAESPRVIHACAELGLEAVSGECILMFAKPTGVHKAHEWIWGLLGKLPA
jgi:predicted CoA-binding protein